MAFIASVCWGEFFFNFCEILHELFMLAHAKCLLNRAPESWISLLMINDGLHNRKDIFNLYGEYWTINISFLPHKLLLKISIFARLFRFLFVSKLILLYLKDICINVKDMFWHACFEGVLSFSFCYKV